MVPGIVRTVTMVLSPETRGGKVNLDLQRVGEIDLGLGGGEAGALEDKRRRRKLAQRQLLASASPPNLDSLCRRQT